MADIFINEFCTLKSCSALKTARNRFKVDFSKSCCFPACCCMFSSCLFSFIPFSCPHFASLLLQSLFFSHSSDFRCKNGTDARVAAELICFQLGTKQEQKQLINQSLLALRCAETTDGTVDFSKAAFCPIRWQQKRRGKAFVKEQLQMPRGPWKTVKKETHQ